VVLFCLVVGVLPQILGNDKTAVLIHFGVKLKFDQNGLTWFMIWTAVCYPGNSRVPFISTVSASYIMGDNENYF